MNIFRRRRADWISYNEEEGGKYTSTPGKMTGARANSIRLNSSREQRVVVHYGLSF